VLLAALVAAVAAAGCGQEAGHEYRSQLDDAHTAFSKRLVKGRDTTQAKSQSSYARGTRQLRAAADAFVVRLRELDEPAGARDEEAALVTALSDFSDAVGRISVAVRARDKRAIHSAGADVRSGGERIDAAFAALRGAVG